MRVVSLVPSSTETLLALGVDVVACTRFCERPELRHVGGTKNPDVDAIVELGPDLVVVDREENRREDHDALVAAGLDVFVGHVTDVDSAMGLVEQLAEAVGRPWERPSMLARAEPVRRRTALVPIWRRPWMTISAATYGAAVLSHIGIDLAPISSPDAYPTVEPDQIRTARPDVIVVPSEPYEFAEQHVAELAEMVPEAQIARVDGQDLFWWGIRTPGAVSRLAGELALPRMR